MTTLHCKRAMRGFSLVEVLIVTSVTLCIAATAIPKMVSTMANIELRAALRSASGVMQQTRSQAIKEDRARTVKYTNGSSGSIVYADLNGNNQPNSNEPQAQMGTTVMAYAAPTGIPSLSSSELNFTPTTATALTFSGTGQPCNTSGTCAVGMVVYFTDTRAIGAPGWAAVSISPAGRVATWIWTGTAWKD